MAVRRTLPVLVVLTLTTIFHAGTLNAQQPWSLWTGIVADEMRPLFWSPWVQMPNLWRRAISADARFVVFNTEADNLVYGDSNNSHDVFLRDRATGEITRISMAADGSVANGPSHQASISPDGRHIVYASCATNLTNDDTNGVCDVFVHDRQGATTVRVNVGPNGEQGANHAAYASLSANGRYVAFSTTFNPDEPYTPRLWLRDRDSDANGVFDEPGTATTTLISETTVGTEFVDATDDVAISPDGRVIAYIAETRDAEYNNLGRRLYVHYRDVPTTVRIDRPPLGADASSWTSSPDLSETGDLVFATNAPNLVAGDTELDEDVFVFNVYTGGHTHIQLTHPNAPVLVAARQPTINANGRYVTFQGTELSPEGYGRYSIYAVDRQTGQSFEVSVRPDGARDDYSFNPSLNADGSAIVFHGRSQMLVNNCCADGVFVATAVSLSPAQIDAPPAGGVFDVEVTVPANTFWSLRPEFYGDTQEVTPASGVGPAVVQLRLSSNQTGQERNYSLILGSERVAIRQPTGLGLSYITPTEGPTSGGTNVYFVGSGFVEGATVTFDNISATNVIFSSSETITAMAPAHVPNGWVRVVVTNPDGLTAGTDFYYRDVTPPIITHTLTGTRGLNDWFISNVVLDWTVRDDESPVDADCLDYTFDYDFESAGPSCVATSEGGSAVKSVDFKRDATPPVLSLSLNNGEVFAQNEQVTVGYFCEDATSGIATCSAPVEHGGNLDTSTIGTFNFTLTGEDRAGHRVVRTVSYTVKMTTTLVLAPATATYGQSGTLRATLHGNSTPLAGKSVAFYVGNDLVGTGITSSAGEAQVPVPPGRNAGTYSMRVEYTGDDNTLASSDIGVLTVEKATPALTWNSPASIVYGTALDATQLNATTVVAGTFSYDPGEGVVPNAGSKTLSVTFTPEDTANYTTASASVTLQVAKATPSIMWANPAAIVYGAALSGTQLNASADLPGTFAYTPASGSVLAAGTHSLNVTFTPTDAANYESVSSSVSLTVEPASTTITWTDPAAIVYGTSLGSTQLNATANVPGTFAYAPAAGTQLAAGTHSLSVTFTPNDAANYSASSKSVPIVVNKATPIVSWSAPSTINYGTALSATQLNATANVAGTFSYSPAAGTVLGGGTQVLSVTFTPTDAANYTSASGSTSISVAPVGLSIQTNNASKVYGEALPAFTATGAGFVNGDTLGSLNGTLSFATTATATSAPGTYAVTPGGVSSANYTITFAAGSLTVTKASTTLTLTSTPNPSANRQSVQLRAQVSAVAPGAGTASGTVEFRDNGVLLGTAPLVNGVATLTVSFNKKGTHPLTASFAGDANFNGSSRAVSHLTN